MSKYRPQTSVRYCPHGSNPCTGNPDAGLPPCQPGEYVYCAHGFDDRLITDKENQPRCPYCRGETRKDRNRTTYRPRRTDTTTVLRPETHDESHP